MGKGAAREIAQIDLRRHADRFQSRLLQRLLHLGDRDARGKGIGDIDIGEILHFSRQLDLIQRAERRAVAVNRVAIDVVREMPQASAKLRIVVVTHCRYSPFRMQTEKGGLRWQSY